MIRPQQDSLAPVESRWPPTFLHTNWNFALPKHTTSLSLCSSYSILTKCQTDSEEIFFWGNFYLWYLNHFFINYSFAYLRNKGVWMHFGCHCFVIQNQRAPSIPGREGFVIDHKGCRNAHVHLIHSRASTLTECRPESCKHSELKALWIYRDMLPTLNILEKWFWKAAQRLTRIVSRRVFKANLLKEFQSV